MVPGMSGLPCASPERLTTAIATAPIDERDDRLHRGCRRPGSAASAAAGATSRASARGRPSRRTPPPSAPRRTAPSRPGCTRTRCRRPTVCARVEPVPKAKNIAAGKTSVKITVRRLLSIRSSSMPSAVRLNPPNGGTRRAVDVDRRAAHRRSPLLVVVASSAVRLRNASSSPFAVISRSRASVLVSNQRATASLSVVRRSDLFGRAPRRSRRRAARAGPLGRRPAGSPARCGPRSAP